MCDSGRVAVGLQPPAPLETAPVSSGAVSDGPPRQRSGAPPSHLQPVDQGPAFRLARKGLPHGRSRQSSEGPQRSAGPAQRVDGRDRPCVVNALRAKRGPYPAAPRTGLNPPHLSFRRTSILPTDSAEDPAVEWADYAEENLLDRRLEGPFRGRGALVKRAERELKLRWETGTAAEVTKAMSDFIARYQRDFFVHAPVPREQHEAFELGLVDLRSGSSIPITSLYGTALRTTASISRSCRREPAA